MGDELVVQELILYPIKGCKGISLPSAVLTPLGLASSNCMLRDRTWMVVRPNGKFITQRQKGQLALVETTIFPPPSTPGLDAAHASLVLRAPGMPELRVSIAFRKGLEERQVACWEWTGPAFDEGPEAAAWLTSFLGVDAGLVRHANIVPPEAKTGSQDRFHRGVAECWMPPGVAISWQDQFPFLFACTASLEDLNDQIPGDETVPMNRFRPNVVIAGGTPWQEDQWSTLELGGGGFNAPKPCTRCKVPSIDQKTGIEGAEPQRTMHETRLGSVLGWTGPPGFKGAVFFGVNVCMTSSGATGVAVRCGDPLTVTSLRTGPPTTLDAAK